MPVRPSRPRIAAVLSLLAASWIGPRCTCAHEAATPVPDPPARAHACCAPRVPAGPVRAVEAPAPAAPHDPDCAHCQATDGPPAALKPTLAPETVDPGAAWRGALAASAAATLSAAPVAPAFPPWSTPAVFLPAPSTAALCRLRI